MGQQILYAVGLSLTMVVALLPASLVAAVVFFIALWVIGPIGAGALGLLAVLVCLGTEIALAILWLGKRFEHFDLSVELKA
jgi:ABC-2 type transport system permease protein